MELRRMSYPTTQEMFNVTGKVVVITGAGGVLCSEMARFLAAQGAHIVVADLDGKQAKRVADEINAAGKGTAVVVEVNVLARESIEGACQCVVESFGKVDVLINGAGGNRKEATVSKDTSFFQLDPQAIRSVFDLNCLGTILPSQAFGRVMAERKEGVILNVASMSGYRPLTNIAAYSGAKAAVANFTQWLATHMAQNYSPKIRVNAIAPGFFLTQQNRFLLTDEKTGELTKRGRQILDHTPAGRFGEPGDLLGTVLWLLSDAARFVTGTVVPVDGGFNAYSGV
jgi:NAD(P)-dependent dehydrogenase (short-subunit alcohol dehydrogenase family)